MKASSAGDARGVAVAPRRSWVAITVPLVVAGLTAGIVAWSAWPSLRPARGVTVTQAVFDRAVAPPSDPVKSSSESLGGGKMVQAAGWLEAEPFVVACTALADGVVESIDVLEGDRVSVVLSPYDLTRGRVVYRHK